MEHREDVADVEVEVDVGPEEVRPVTDAGHRRRVHVVAGRSQERERPVRSTNRREHPRAPGRRSPASSLLLAPRAQCVIIVLSHKCATCREANSQIGSASVSSLDDSPGGSRCRGERDTARSRSQRRSRCCATACGNAGSSRASRRRRRRRRCRSRRTPANDLHQGRAGETRRGCHRHRDPCGCRSRRRRIRWAATSASLNDGIDAYFGFVNSQGGIYGRQLKLTSKRDDMTSNNATEAQALLSQDNVYAAFIATELFTGAPVLAKAGIPTFGWNINAEWAGPTNFFPNVAPQCFAGCGLLPHVTPWLAQQAKAHRVAMIGYSVPQAAVVRERQRRQLRRSSGRTWTRRSCITTGRCRSVRPTSRRRCRR